MWLPSLWIVAEGKKLTIRRWRQLGPMVSVIGAGLALTILAARWQWREALSHDRTHFAKLVERINEEADSRLEFYEGALRRLRDLFEQTPEPPRLQWRHWLDQLQLRLNHPGLVEVGFARNTGFPCNPEIIRRWEKNAGEPIVVPKEPTDWGAVLYRESLSPAARRPLGENLRYGENERGLSDAYKTAGPRITWRFDAAIGEAGANLSVFRMFLATYTSPEALGVAAEATDFNAAATVRGNALHGWVFGTFMLEKVLKPILESNPEVGLEVFDRAEFTAARRLLPRTGPVKANSGFQATYQGIVESKVYGNRWQTFFYSTPLFDAHSQRGRAWWILAGGLGLTAALALVFWVQLKARLEAEKHGEELWEARDLLEALSREQEAVGRDLHDSLLQSLYSLSLGLQKTRKVLRRRPTEAENHCQQNIASLELLMGEVRRYLGRGAKQRTEGLDVSTAFRMLAEAANRQGNVPVILQLDEIAASQVTSEASLHLLQIAREAISNAARHGGASRITLRLHPHGDHVELSVEDDGAGFDPDSTHGPGYGLGNMRARAAEIGAEFELNSRPGAGARLSVRLSTASGHTSGITAGPTNGTPRRSAEVPA